MDGGRRHVGAVAESQRGPDAIARLKDGLAAWRTLGAAIFVPYFLSLLARAYGQSGQTSAGRETIAEALECVRCTGERMWEAELYRLKGELMLGPASRATDHDTQAEACFHQALAIARHQGARSLELRAVASLARLWQRHGKTEAAREALAPVVGAFTEGLQTADVKEAHAVLRGLASRTLTGLDTGRP